MSCRTRKRKEDEERKANDGEQDNFFTDEMREEMKAMWEIPQIFHFLHLTKESLNIPQLSLYEMERMLLIPRASKQLANIMTCMLSSPTTKLRKVPPMPYEFWTNILAYKMTSWFKVYRAKHEDATKVLETIGVEPEFWNIFPETSMLDGRDFEDLSFKQRVWLLKTVCDTIMHTRKTVQEDMMNQSWQDQFETVLGIDRNGTRYIYFPQFMPNDFRIYRHSLDNKILSTVRPVRQERESERNKFMKYRKRKLQIRNSLSDRRSNKHENRNDDKDLSNNDSTTGSFISEDTNLSSTSTCSNNNNISLDVINRKHRRSLSKMSEESLQSNARSSGYDTNTSSDNKFIDDESSQMFKGFINTPNENCNIEIINEMLDDLKTEIDEEKRINGSSSSSELASQEDFVEYKSTAVFRSETVVEKDENERLSDNLSNSSKTDDEKLNEIINAESLKLPEDVYSKSISASDNVSDISTLTSKSDDEKLNETKASNSSISINENNLNKVIFNKLFGTSSSINNVSLDEEVSRENCSVPEMQSVIEAELNDPSEKNLRTGMKLRSQKVVKQYDQKNKTEATKVEIKEKQELKDVQVDETEEENFSISEMRLQTNMEYDLDDYINNTDVDYNLQRSKSPKTDECKQRFNKMLSDLSVSDFNLVADSVEGLRDLVALFTANNSESKNSNNAEIVPLCEVKLVKKMTELLNSLEPAETTIKDAMRKAKAKLQREWTNFKEGARIHSQPPPEMQRYKRYRSLPYPHLAPKTPKNSRDKSTKASTKVQLKIPSKITTRAGKRVTSGETKVTRNSQMSRQRQEKTKSRKREKDTGKVRAHQTTKMQSGKRSTVDEYYERAVSLRTQNSFTQTTRATRTSWRNGPTLRQCTRLPAHRPIHPLLTLIRKTETLATGRKRRTQTRIGFYRALAKGKINVRLPIEG